MMPEVHRSEGCSTRVALRYFLVSSNKPGISDGFYQQRAVHNHLPGKGRFCKRKWPILLTHMSCIARLVM